jgi:hypothetical protein
LYWNIAGRFVPFWERNGFFFCSREKDEGNAALKMQK